MIAVRARRGPAVWRAVDGFVTVASPDGRSVRAAGSAAAIWDLLPDPGHPSIDVAEIVDRLATEHRADLNAVASDTRRVLVAWEAIGCAVLES